MAAIYFDFKVNTEQLGELNFFTITHDRLAKSEKFAIGHENDRTLVVQILHGYLMDENISIEDINVLSDSDIESIARQLLEKSRLSDKLDETTAKGNGFFFSFRNAYKEIIVEEKKSRANLERLFTSGSAKIVEDAFRHSKNYSFLDDIGNRKSLFNAYPGQSEIAADKIASEIRNQ